MLKNSLPGAYNLNWQWFLSWAGSQQEMSVFKYVIFVQIWISTATLNWKGNLCLCIWWKGLCTNPKEKSFTLINETEQPFLDWTNFKIWFLENHPDWGSRSLGLVLPDCRTFNFLMYNFGVVWLLLIDRSCSLGRMVLPRHIILLS